MSMGRASEGAFCVGHEMGKSFLPSSFTVLNWRGKMTLHVSRVAVRVI